MFTDKEHRAPFEFSDEIGNLAIGAESADSVVLAQRVEENDKDLLLTTSEKEQNGALSHNGSAYDAPLYSSSALVPIPDTQSSAQTQQSSLAIDDLLGLSLQPEPAPPSLKLKEKAVLDPATFQQKWRQLPISLSKVCFISYISNY